MTDSRMDAANGFYTVILDRLTDENGVHAETAVAAAGRMAGTFLLRSLRLPIDDFPPGRNVFSDAANDSGPGLIGLLADALQQLNVSIDPRQATPAQANAAPPQLTILETQALLEQPLTTVKESHRLTYGQAAEASVMTAALIVQACSPVLYPNAAFTIAVSGIVEGSKTVPFRPGDQC